MAGSWATLANRQGYLYNALNRPIGVIQEATADAAAATFPDTNFAGLSGLVTAIDVEFDTGVTPDTITITPKTIGGITLKTATTLTASGRITFSPPVDVCGGLTLDMTGTANSVNSAKFKAVVLVR